MSALVVALVSAACAEGADIEPPPSTNAGGEGVGGDAGAGNGIAVGGMSAGGSDAGGDGGAGGSLGGSTSVGGMGGAGAAPTGGTGGMSTGGMGGGGPMCGDQTCDPNETCLSCEADCGACTAICGDAMCEVGQETCDSCYQDCGVCACVPDLLERNQSSAAAKGISPSTDVCMLSLCAGDTDWFEFTSTGNTMVTLTYTYAEGDIDLEIYRASTLAYVTGSYTSTDNEVVTFTQPAGQYWARVIAGDGGENPGYCIRVDPN